MCQSYKKVCVCNQKTAEIFFGKMVLDEKAIAELYCPNCSHGIDTGCNHRVWDNGWVLELDMDVLRTHANSMDISPAELTAEWVFDEGYATWVGITPDDAERRNLERAEIQKLAKTDLRAYYEAMKAWGLNREKRFSQEGWRKMRAHG
ncbi:MAG: hypothetical protein JSV83_06345 [Desulfobacterales bacterium]|nr:MAG: hypothetical protein JSV83_06345 [Desulfobacterales bacterium]